MNTLSHGGAFIIDVGHDFREEKEEDNSESWKDADFLSLNREQDDADTGTKEIATAEEKKNLEAKEIREKGSIPVIHKFTDEVAPWMTLKGIPPPTRYHGRNPPPVPPLLALHNEIVGFAKIVSPQEMEIEARQKLIADIEQVAHSVFTDTEQCKVTVFGSQATKLFLPSSDIDIVIYISEDEKDETGTSETSESAKAKEHREMKEWDEGKDTRSPLVRLADGLRSFYKDQLTYLEIVENTRIPIVKFTHGPTKISVDVCFNQEGGPEAAQIMNKFLDDMPPLRPLVFVLKYFMKVRGINQPYSGGMGSFMLQMMIVSFLQHRAREEYNKYRRSIIMNLGSLLLEFFEFYSLDFNYFTTAISVRNDGSYFPKGANEKREHFYQPLRPNSLAIENPMDITSDVGKSTFRMNQIQRSFDVAFRLLLSHVSIPIVSAKSVLASILPPTEELRKRANLLNALYTEESDTDDEYDDQSFKGKNASHKRRKKQKATRKKKFRQTQYNESSDEDDYFVHNKKKSRRYKADRNWDSKKDSLKKRTKQTKFKKGYGGNKRSR